MTDFKTSSDPATPSSGAASRDITITELEAAINYWRGREPSHGDEMKLCAQANALSKPYALMIVQRHRTLALSELELEARLALEAYESLGNGP